MSEDRPVFNDSAIMCPGHGFVLAERRRSRGCNVSWLLHLVALQARIVNLSFIITPVHTAESGSQEIIAHSRRVSFLYLMTR